MKTTQKIIFRCIEVISVILLIIFGIKTHMFDDKINSKLYGFCEFIFITAITILIIEYIAKNIAIYKTNREANREAKKRRYSIQMEKNSRIIDTEGRKIYINKEM